MWEQTNEAEREKNQKAYHGRTADYTNATHEVATIKTVSDFWKNWNLVPQPSDLLMGKRFIRASDSEADVYAFQLVD